jgi:radical SAM protein with 4Fe4S-binding SPASM domain
MALMSLFETISADTKSLLQGSGALDKMRPRLEPMRPLMVIVETINVCNSACVFCPYTIQTRPKGVMKQALFEQTVSQYIDIGGGILSLTPMVGDVLLDRKLRVRLEFLRSVEKYIEPSVTTNLFALRRWSDDVVVEMLRTFKRMHVSCYGITHEECCEITKTDFFEEFCSQMRRLLGIAEEIGLLERVALGFRVIYDYSAEQLADFQIREFGRILHMGAATPHYCNWGNTMRGSLPGHARYVQDRENTTTCALLAIGLMVFWDGRVSACICCDYNGSHELSLGNVVADHLQDLYNNTLSQQLWLKHQHGRLPAICKNCTFHVPLEKLSRREVNNLLEIVGG